MGKRWVRTVAVAATAGALVLTGQPAADASRPPVPVHAATQHPVTAPDVLRPGLVHLRNTGQDDLMLVRKIHAGVASFVRDLNDRSASQDGPRLFRQFHLVDLITGRQDLYVRFRPGTYYLVDASAERIHTSDVHVITVRGARQNATAPTKRAITIQAGTNALSAPRFGHTGSFVHVRNENHRLQELLMFRIRPSATRAQVAAFFAHPNVEGLFGLISTDFSGFSPVAITAGGEDLYVRLPKKAARYIVVDVPFTQYLSGLVAPKRVRLLTLV